MTAEEQGSPLFVAPHISAMSADAAIATFIPLMTMMARLSWAASCDQLDTADDPDEKTDIPGADASDLADARPPDDVGSAPEYSRKVLRVTGITEHAPGY